VAQTFASLTNLYIHFHSDHSESMARTFVLSGHFFSPAEIDPWSGLRHDYSPSENYHTKFQQLARTCWGANSASRILRPDGKIHKIVNNYQHLAFSFSPLLLEELSERAPNVYRRIVDADAQAVQKLGYGNALAQCWNPVVLPLLEPRQMRRQLEWGLAAFEKHFKRRAEGFWLPHQAISDRVVDQLIALKIPFVLLSSWQAEAIMPAEEGSWIGLGGGPPPSDRTYRLDRPSGSLGVFVEDSLLSEKLFDEELLQDASRFAQRLDERLVQQTFASLATDGALFGLKEPFADMCLAALWDKLSDLGVEVVNYGVIWSRQPPLWQIRLKKGHNEEGTSSDCTHGVQRWKSDCGCTQGGEPGWNQRWRPGVFRTLVNLEEALNRAETQVLRELGIYLQDWEAALPALFLHLTPARNWVRALAGGLSQSQEDDLLSWAWVAYWSQAMMGSNLWHEADPFLPDARVGFLAALRALELAESGPSKPLFQQFLLSLEVASNSGATIRQRVEQDLLNRRHGPEFAAALVVFDRLMRPEPRYTERLGIFALVKFSLHREKLSDGTIRYSGGLTLHHTDLDQHVVLEYLLVEDLSVGAHLSFTTPEHPEKPVQFDLEWLPVGERKEIVQWLGNALESMLASQTQSFYPLLQKALVYSRFLEVPPQPLTRSLMELAVTRQLLELASRPGLPTAEVLLSLEQELKFADDFGLILDRERLNERFSLWLFSALGNPAEFTTLAVVNSVETLLGKLFAWGFQPDITVAQSLVFEALQERGPALLAAIEKGELQAQGDWGRLLKLAEFLLIDTELSSQLID